MLNCYIVSQGALVVPLRVYLMGLIIKMITVFIRDTVRTCLTMECKEKTDVVCRKRHPQRFCPLLGFDPSIRDLLTIKIPIVPLNIHINV